MGPLVIGSRGRKRVVVIEDQRVLDLAAEYWRLIDELRALPHHARRRRLARHGRQLEILRQVSRLKPKDNPLEVIDRWRPTS